jgi:hypothetical protein
MLNGITINCALATAASPLVVEGIAEGTHLDGPEAEFAAIFTFLK